MIIEAFDPLPGLFQIPQFDQIGEANITILAVGSDGSSTAASFRFSVVSPTGNAVPPSSGTSPPGSVVPPSSGIIPIVTPRPNPIKILGLPTSMEAVANQPVSPIEFSLKGVQTDVNSLDIRAQSSDQQIISDRNLSIVRTGLNCTLTITPEPNRMGITVITVIVVGSDGNSATHTFQLRVRLPPEPPKISDIPDQTSLRNQRSNPIQFTITDSETPPQRLKVTATPSEYVLVQGNPFTWGTIGTDPTLEITPAPGQVGTVTITVTVTDEDNLSASDTFIFRVVGHPPTISDLADQTPAWKDRVQVIPFQLFDRDTPSDKLTVSVTSANEWIIGEKDIVLSGKGSDRLITITRTGDRSGTTRITITVTDDEGQSATDSFDFTVPPPPAPLLSPIPNQRILPNQLTRFIGFTIDDEETPADLLGITAWSSNQLLVPNQNILFGGSLKDRIVLVAPATGQLGIALITVKVTNKHGVATTESFYLIVETDSSPPRISEIDEKTIARNELSPLILFTVESSGTPADLLKVTAASSNKTLVPDDNIVITGSGENRAIAIRPTQEQTGRATISVTATDLLGVSATETFDVVIKWAPRPLRDDFNKDGRSDLVFEDAVGNRVIWLMKGTTAESILPVSMDKNEDPRWRLIGTGDFDKDGKIDLACQYLGGALEIWFMNGSRRVAYAPLTTQLDQPGWRGVATSDFDQDGYPDLLFQHDDGTLAVWFLQGIQLVSTALLSPSGTGNRDWRVAGVADFDQNDTSDLLFQHTNGTLAIWYLDGSKATDAAFLDPMRPGDAQWRVRSIGDLDGDAQPDLVFQHSRDGSLAAWLMNGLRLKYGALLQPSRIDAK